MEERWENVLREHFNIPHNVGEWFGTALLADQKRRIKALDLLMLGREMIDLMACGQHDQSYLSYLDDRTPADLPRVRPWSMRKSKRRFLIDFHKYSGTPLPWYKRTLMHLGVYWIT